MSTDESSYTERLNRLGSARWKQLLNVQAPYRWNLRRLELGRTLDIGCGIGRNLANLADGVGVDHNPDSVGQARQSGLTAWTTAEWPRCEDAELQSFDTMLVAHVLEHMSTEQAGELLSDYVKYLRRQAKLVLICPQEAGFRSDDTHVRFLTGADLAELADQLGFQVTRNYSFPLPRFTGRAFRYNEFVVVAQRP